MFRDEIETVLEGAVACLLWTTPHADESGSDSLGYLEDTHDITDIDGQSLDSLREELRGFIALNHDNLSGLTDSQIGHDFILTRNGHGAGFWDRGLGDRGDRLSDAAKVYGSIDAYIGDDGKVYFS